MLRVQNTEYSHIDFNICNSKIHRSHVLLAERLKNWNNQPYELTEEDRAWLNMEPVGDEVEI